MAKTVNGLSQLLNYLVNIPDSSGSRIPPLNELSKELQISIATLREQLEVARVLGIVEVKPKTGIHKNNFSFYQAIKPGLDYAVMDDVTNFQHFAGLRKHLESAYFVEAAQSLSLAELNSLENLVQSALSKIEGSPIQLPNEEHRDFHMKIFANIENPFLQGLLETYWDLYHFHDFEYFPDHDYLLRVWHYHMRIIEQVKNRNFTQALALLIEHMDLLKQREKVVPRLSFE